MIHYYFGSKEKLFCAMAKAIYNDTIPVQESWFDGLEPSSKLDALFRLAGSDILYAGINKCQITAVAW